MSNQNNEESQELKPGRDAVKTGKNIADIANFAASGTNPISAAKSAADIGKGIKNKADEKKNKFKNNARKLNNYVADLNNMPINSNSRMGGNKSKKNNKKGENQDSKGVLDRAKRLLKKKRLKAIKRRIRMVRRIIRFIAGISVFVFMSVGIFLLSNPVTATILVALGVAQKYGILGYVAEAWEWCCDALEQVSDWAEDTWDLITDWIWPTDDHDDGTGNKEEQYDMSEIDNNDQYREALLKNYDLCKVICEDAFALAKDDADEYAETHGYDDYTIVNAKGESLKGAKWDTLYKTEESQKGAADGINWGNLIIAMDICYSAENKTAGVNENYQYEDVDYDPNVLEDYMEEGKDDENADCNLRHLYHINAVEVEPDVYNVIITPFDITDLYEIGGLKPEDMFDINTTYYDMIQTRQRQLKTVLASEEVYQTLGLYNETPLRENRKDIHMGDLATGNISIDDICDEGSNRDKIWNALIEEGFSEIGASALMGNMWAEHSFSTAWEGEGGSVGIVQWTGKRKERLLELADQLSDEAIDPTDINLQIVYMINYDFPDRMAKKYEPTGNSLYNEIKDATELQLATDIVCAYYETCERWYTWESVLENHKYGPVSRYVKSTAWYSYKGKSGYWYWIDLGKRRAYAEKIYATYHTE